MTFIDIATLAVGVGCGFAVAVWVLVSIWHWRYNSRWTGFWYVVLALAYLMCTVIIAGRALGNFENLPRGISLLMLTPILAVPPAIQWAAWLKARRLIREQRGG